MDTSAVVTAACAFIWAARYSATTSVSISRLSSFGISRSPMIRRRKRCAPTQASIPLSHGVVLVGPPPQPKHLKCRDYVVCYVFLVWGVLPHVLGVILPP